MKFKIGDKVIVKKFSEKEFEEVYNKYENYNWSYKKYLDTYKNFFGKTFTIQEIDVEGDYWMKEIDYWFYEEELEFAYTIKEKIEFVKEMMLDE